MTADETALLLFTACNSLRVLAYVPQILQIARDNEGAKAISFTTWGLFALSHLSTAAYAVATVHDLAMALVFGGNALSCLLIIGLTAWKRRGAEARPLPETLPARPEESSAPSPANPAPPVRAGLSEPEDFNLAERLNAAWLVSPMSAVRDNLERPAAPNGSAPS